MPKTKTKRNAARIEQGRQIREAHPNGLVRNAPYRVVIHVTNPPLQVGDQVVYLGQGAEPDPWHYFGRDGSVFQLLPSAVEPIGPDELCQVDEFGNTFDGDPIPRRLQAVHGGMQLLKATSPVADFANDVLPGRVVSITVDARG